MKYWTQVQQVALLNKISWCQNYYSKNPESQIQLPFNFPINQNEKRELLLLFSNFKSCTT
ncbi:MAG: hypothetical protein KIS82_09770 [Ferruginibacter sp.]|nr:hypothetical protein [Ferruginibacter sp.]